MSAGESPLPGLNGAEEIRPFLLYRTDDRQASFALWRLASGEQALTLFVSEELAARYRDNLADAGAWTIYQPPRDKLLEIFAASLEAQIKLAALNPGAGGARSLFDLAQVVAAAKLQQP
jgi:hypothetical protein